MYVVRADKPNDFIPINLNGGFADPDPKYEKWEPPKDTVPISGNGKDSRFTEEAMWSTKPMRSQRPANGLATTDHSQSTESKVKARANPKSVPKLDGTGSWGDFGVKGAATTPVNRDKSKKLEQDPVKESPVLNTVPNTIDGMNRVLQERVRAASAKTTAAYASAMPSAQTQATQAVPPPVHNKFVPPHMSKPVTNDEDLARSVQAAEFGLEARAEVRSVGWP